jgi:hypothetical protein
MRGLATGTWDLRGIRRENMAWDERQFAPYLRRDGSVVDTTLVSTRVPRANLESGSLCRAVILGVKPYDELFPGIRCSVFVYASNPAACGPLDNVVLTYPNSSMQGGDIMLPRRCSRQLADIKKGIAEGNLNPKDLDGDHVLIGSVDGRRDQLYIVSFLPHPNVDKGKTAVDALGYRILPQEGEGEPAFKKHRGVFSGVDDSGNYTANTTNGHKGPSATGVAADGGGYTAEGTEVPSTQVDGTGVATSGNYTVKLKQNAKLLIEFESGNKIELTDNDGALTLKVDSVQIGDGATEAAVLGDALSTWLTTNLTVGTAFGPSGPSTVPLGSSELSTSVKLKG